jgi:hypothetical protein
MRVLCLFAAATVCGFVLTSGNLVRAAGVADAAAQTSGPSANEKAPSAGDRARPKARSSAPLSKTAAAEKTLTDKGLKKEDRQFLLDETAAVKKYEELKQQYQDFQEARMKYGQILEYDETYATMQLQQQSLKAEAAQLQNQINRANSGVNRRMRGIVNQELAPYRQQEAAMVSQANQMNQQLNAMKANAPKPDVRKNASTEYEKTRQVLNDTVKELEPLVAPLVTQYHELALDPAIIDALATLHHETNLNYKLGPSDELHAAAKLMKDMKLMPKHGKPTHKSKSGAKSK